MIYHNSLLRVILVLVLYCGALNLSFGYVAHDSSIAYEKDDIVVSDGVSYVSVQTVPIGVAISSTTYWIPLLSTIPTAPTSSPPTTQPNDSDLTDYETPADNNDTDEDGIADNVEEELGSNPEVSDAAVFNYGKSIGIEEGKNLVLGDLSTYSLVTESEHEQLLAELNASAQLAIEEARVQGIEEGKNEVLENPAAFSLVTQSENLSSISLGVAQGVQSVLANPSAYNLLPISEHESALESLQLSVDCNATPYTDGWFFMPGRGWLWTTKAAYPWLYDTSSNNWLHFKEGGDTPTFYEYASQRWVDWTEFLNSGE